MYLAAAIVLFLAFLGNVLLGSLGDGAVLGNVGEMLLLAGVSVFFVAAILRAERTRLRESGEDPVTPPETLSETPPEKPEARD